jgi:hypothetical protein
MGPFDVKPKLKKAAEPRVKRGEDTDLKSRETQLSSGAAGSRTLAVTKDNATAQLANRHDALYADIKALQAARGERVIVREPVSGREWLSAGGMLPFKRTLYDPYSYTNTVENIFYFSRLVKEGFASMMWARRTLGKEDKPGSAATGQGKAWEPFIAVLSTEEFQKRSAKDRSVVPPDAVLAVDAPKPAAAGGAGGAGAAAAAAAAEGGKRAARVQGPSKEELEAQAVEERKRRGLGVSWQLVVELDHESWRAVCSGEKLTEPAVGHRRVSDSTAPKGFKYREDGPALAAQAGGKRKRGGGEEGGEEEGGEEEGEEEEEE